MVDDEIRMTYGASSLSLTHPPIPITFLRLTSTTGFDSEILDIPLAQLSQVINHIKVLLDNRFFIIKPN